MLSAASAEKVLRELKKIKLAWPELNYSTAPGVSDPASLQLRPSRRSTKPNSVKLRLSHSGPLSGSVSGLFGLDWTL